MVSNANFGLVYGAGVNLWQRPGALPCKHVMCAEAATSEGWIRTDKSGSVTWPVSYCAYHAVRMLRHWEKYGSEQIEWELHDITQGPVTEGEDWE